MKHVWSSVIFVAALSFGSAALAEGMKVEPGKWEFRTTSKAPMQPQPETRVSTTCIEKPEITPETFMRDSKDCSVSGAETTATSMKWKVSCPNPHGQVNGHAEFTSAGEAVEGSMQMTMSFGSQSMSMEQRWEGKRLGACD